jgi:hypothetical protein
MKMTDKAGPGYVASHIEAATDMVGMLQTHIATAAPWKRIVLDLRGAGHRTSDALTTNLVIGAAGALAATAGYSGGLEGECAGCAAEPLLDAGILRPQDMPALYTALDCAASLAVGLLRGATRPPDVTQESWLRGSYAAARIAYAWSVEYSAAA